MAKKIENCFPTFFVTVISSKQYFCGISFISYGRINARMILSYCTEAEFLVWIGYVPVLKYVPFRRKANFCIDLK
jgi:hypothetical protein